MHEVLGAALALGRRTRGAGAAVIVRRSALGRPAKGKDVGFEPTLMKREGKSLVTRQCGGGGYQKDGTRPASLHVQAPTSVRPWGA